MDAERPPGTAKREDLRLTLDGHPGLWRLRGIVGWVGWNPWNGGEASLESVNSEIAESRERPQCLMLCPFGCTCRVFA